MQPSWALHILSSTDSIIAVIKATYLLQSVLSKEADIYPVITGTKAQPSFVSLCCLAIAMTLRGPPLSTSSSQSPIRSDAIRAERSHWANSIPAFKTRLSNLVNRGWAGLWSSQTERAVCPQGLFGTGMKTPLKMRQVLIGPYPWQWSFGALWEKIR